MYFEYKLGSSENTSVKEVDDDTKNILWWYRFHFLDKIPYRLSKPLGNCLICMASVFSFIPYWFYYRFDFLNFEVLICYPLYILGLAGLNAIWDTIVNQ